MIKLIAFAALLTAAALPLAASAQSNDAAYCAALTSKYQLLIGSNTGRNLRPDVGAEVAIDKCKAGNYAAGIPVLEGKLRDAKVELPPRT